MKRSGGRKRIRNKEEYRRWKKRSSQNVMVIDKKPLSNTLRGAPISFCRCNREIMNLHLCGLQDDKCCANVKDLLRKCAMLSSEWKNESGNEMKALTGSTGASASRDALFHVAAKMIQVLQQTAGGVWLNVFVCGRLGQDFYRSNKSMADLCLEWIIAPEFQKFREWMVFCFWVFLNSTHLSSNR